MVPQNYQKLESEEHIKLMEKLIEIMEDDDDVQNIWHTTGKSNLSLMTLSLDSDLISVFC